MRILILSQYFWPEEFKINDLALGLQARGHEVSVLTGMPNYPLGKFLPGYGMFGPYRQDWHGIRINRVPLVSRGKKGAFRLGANYLSFALSSSMASAQLAQSADVVFVYQPSPVTVGIPAALFKRMWDIPIVFWIQDLWPDSLSAAEGMDFRLTRPVGYLTKWIYEQCDRILYGSHGYLERILETAKVDDRLEYFPQWAEAFYRPVERNARPDIDALMPPGFRILFAGNIGRSQSFQTILHAATETRGAADLQWIIVGDGRMRDWLAAEVRERALENVTLLPWARAKEMPHYFASADCLLLTLKQNDLFARTMPTKLPTYLACGRPILAAIDGETAAIVRDSGAGIAVAAEDAKALAAAALQLRSIPADERKKLGEAGLAYSRRKFDRERLLDQLERTLQRMIQASRPVPAAAPFLNPGIRPGQFERR